MAPLLGWDRRIVTAPRAQVTSPDGVPIAVLNLEDPYFDGQSLPDALVDYDHAHSTTGVCVKNVNGPLCGGAR
jgi:hypothetical protein